MMYVIFPSPRPDALKRFPVLLSLLLFLFSFGFFENILPHATDTVNCLLQGLLERVDGSSVPESRDLRWSD